MTKEGRVNASGETAHIGNTTERSITFRNPAPEAKAVESVSKSIPKEHQIKDLDMEIQKIQEKIKKTEEQKRKLWLE